MPPWICPSTKSGLIALPQSSTATYRRKVTSPVSRSTSTTQTWVPNGKVKFFGSNEAVALRPGSNPSGIEAARCAALATSAKEIDWSPAEKVPPENVTASGDAAPRRYAASGSADCHVSASKRPDPVLHLRGVAVLDQDVLEADPKKIGRELGEGCFFPLSVRGRSGEDGHFSGGLHPNSCALPTPRRNRRRGSERADLRVRRDANPNQPALIPQRALLLAQLFDSGDFQGAVERLPIVAAVVGQPRGGLEWELLGVRHVPASQVGRIDVHLIGDDVHQSLDLIRRLGPTRSAICVRRHLVGIDAGDFHQDRVHLVAAGRHQPGESWDCWAEQLGIGPEILDRAIAHAEDPPITVDRGLDRSDLSAAVNRCGEIFRSGLDPLQRARRELHCQERQEDFLGVEIQLGPKPAPYLWSDDSHVILWKADYPCEHGAHQVRNLRRRVQGELSVAGEVLSNDSSRFNRAGD